MKIEINLDLKRIGKEGTPNWSKEEFYWYAWTKEAWMISDLMRYPVPSFIAQTYWKDGKILFNSEGRQVNEFEILQLQKLRLALEYDMEYVLECDPIVDKFLVFLK